MAEFDWTDTTFDGTRRRQAIALAAVSPAERLALLEQLLQLALASGSLGREREARQRAVDSAWAGG